MPKVVDELAHNAALTAQRREINLGSFTTVKDAARTAEFLETLEAEYFSKIRATLEKEEQRKEN